MVVSGRPAILENAPFVVVHDVITRSVERALCQLHHACSEIDAHRLRENIASSISYPNKPKANGEIDVSGKPYDIEVRIALKLYHQWKPQPQPSSSVTPEKDPDPDVEAREQINTSVAVTITSDLGLSRVIFSPKQLAELLAPMLEEDIRANPQWGLDPDVRCQPSGVLSLITWQRSQALRQSMMLPCPRCIKWCKGEKGLWWHQQLHHKQEHEQAAAVAQATSTNEFAMVLYAGGDNNTCLPFNDTPVLSERISKENFTSDPINCIHEGDLVQLQRLVKHGSFLPATYVDRKGATPLMWAAGGGYLEMVQYLVRDCDCDPMKPQKGKRSFAGRTALHWAARNGHLNVVQYLLAWAEAMSLSQKRTMLEAATRDGTTAFGWACWQRHLDVMEYLHQQGCVVDGVNSFGCSPVLWCSQGSNGDGLAALQWLQAHGCDMRRVNHNGHGVLHKTAQRGQQDAGIWFVEVCIGDTKFANSKEVEEVMALVGPDKEGYCPSDLAGMEGHDDFAKFLARMEMELCRSVQRVPSFDLPEGYGEYALATNITGWINQVYTWEKYGGLRRMRSYARIS